MTIHKKWKRLVLFWMMGVLLVLNSTASSEEQIRAGTIEFHTRAASTDEGIATYGFNLTDKVMEESLKINMVFKLDRGNERVRVYEMERAEVDFESKILGKTGVQTEAGIVKMVVPEQGQLKRALSSKECDLTLYIDLKKQTYNITGKVFVSDIPFTSKGKATGKIAGAPPQSEDLSDEWTEEREEEVDINGDLDPEQKDVLSGSESSFDLPETRWMQSFWKGLVGGNIKGTTSWDIRIPMLVIEQDGEDITYDSQKDNIQEEVVGKRINLKGNVKPAHLKMGNPEWVISDGKYLKEFRANEDKGEKVELEDADKKNQEVHFHWYDKGEKLKVTYSAEVEGETLYEEAFFNVKKPSIIMRAEISEGEFAFGRVVYGDERGNQVTEDELIFQPVNRDYTIKFTHDPLPNEFPGETQYIQLVHTIGHVEKNKNALPSCMELNKKGLDETYPYSPGPEATDAPGVPLKPLELNVSVKNHFEMYLMFKPEGEESIFVPLRVINWDWIGLAQREGINDLWDITGSRTWKDPRDRKADDYPEWDLLINSQIQWDLCKEKAHTRFFEMDHFG